METIIILVLIISVIFVGLVACSILGAIGVRTCRVCGNTILWKFSSDIIERYHCSPHSVGASEYYHANCFIKAGLHKEENIQYHINRQLSSYNNLTIPKFNKNDWK